MTTMTAADLRELGYIVKDGKAMRVGQPTKASEEIAASPLVRDLYRSKWERERAAALSLQQMAGVIRRWKHEGIRLKLANGAWYKPDFMVWHNDGLIELEEVKGAWREAARVRWKVAIEQYPMFGFSLWTKTKGQWSRVELYHPTQTDGATR
jgi:hypothetical protein